MDYFGRPASSSNNVPPLLRPGSSRFVPGTPGTPYYDADGNQNSRRPPPPMRIRRLPSTPLLNQAAASSASQIHNTDDAASSSRRRSFSAPQRPHRSLSSPQKPQRTSWSTAAESAKKQQRASNPPLDSLTEETSNATTPMPRLLPPIQEGRARAASDAASTAAEYVLGRKRRSTSTSRPPPSIHESADYEADVVDLLDVIDPEVSTLTTLNNVQNSLFVPNLGRFFNRQPTYNLSRDEYALSRIATADESEGLEMDKTEQPQKVESLPPSIFGYPLSHSHSISSVLSQSHYAVLPHGVVLEGWTEEDKLELNDHVRHLLHSKKAGFRRSMKAFGKYVSTPLGAFVTIYAFLITFWGTAWVLFIIGWLSAGGRQAYFIEICDQVLTALFCVVGIGMAPFRAVDTYHMSYIAKYHFKTLRLRRERGIPDLPDKNDIPEPTRAGDEEMPAEEKDELLLLNPGEQAKFEYHRAKFCKSHTFYKPHATYTHRAFSINLLIAVVVLLDCHSVFQMALGGTTWGINYHFRPKALTAVILTCSICCNISGGLVISIGGKKTRKKEVVERLFRQALTEEALVKLEKEKGLKRSTNEAALEREMLKSQEAGAEYPMDQLAQAAPR